METKLELEVTFSYWVAYWANLQIIRWFPLQLTVSVAFPLAGLYLSYMWFTYDHALQPSDILLLIVCMLFTPLILLITLFLGRRRNPFSGGPFIFLFDEDGIHMSGAAFNMSLKWGAIHKIRESGSFLFFFVAPSRVQAIPLSQLKAAGILGDVYELSRQKVPNTKLRKA